MPRTRITIPGQRASERASLLGNGPPAISIICPKPLISSNKQSEIERLGREVPWSRDWAGLLTARDRVVISPYLGLRLGGKGWGWSRRRRAADWNFKMAGRWSSAPCTRLVNMIVVVCTNGRVCRAASLHFVRM